MPDGAAGEAQHRRLAMCATPTDEAAVQSLPQPGKAVDRLPNASKKTDDGYMCMLMTHVHLCSMVPWLPQDEEYTYMQCHAFKRNHKEAAATYI
ncbi:hypothetical protein NDU88_000979 [Pleurodeles waltl]|uniref:Uncharacterized protein n=1 Tax=Pleurodeles waltl TaxID=8319 RepID=A0AAV7TGJ9_PLEWA|nr:hypothetical protein NDU88_000979 [Pleurodeles waltl]